jgi:hypothetical protein
LSISASASARAEELTTHGNLVLSGERLFGFYLDNQTTERGGRDDTVHRTVLGLGFAAVGGPLSTPRLGIDYFVTNGFTLGGNIGFMNQTVAGRNGTVFTLGFRAGYALRLGHVVSIWPRAGLGFWFESVENASDSHLLTFTVDVPFAFALTEGFAITAGPLLDIGFAGKLVGTNYSELLFGVMIGLSGWTGL